MTGSPEEGWIAQRPTFEERLIATYSTALAAQRGGGRVEIHVGSDTLARLKALVIARDTRVVTDSRLWNFPVVEEVAAATEHLSVHVVHEID